MQYWFLRDNIEGIRQDDLALEDREEAAAVAVQALDYFQAKFSGAKVWYMHPPMADENDYRAKMIGTLRFFSTSGRVHCDSHCIEVTQGGCTYRSAR